MTREPDPTLPDFDLSAFLPYRLAVASARVSRAFAARYSREFGLTIPEWRVLAHLAKGDAVSVRDIHERVDMDKPKVSRAASHLEEKGLVRKTGHKGDGRLVSLTLTAEGRKVMAQLIPMALAYQAELLGELGSRSRGLEAALWRLTEGR
jgi:DNA-binding MarR family transcriptional regulator